MFLWKMCYTINIALASPFYGTRDNIKYNHQRQGDDCIEKIF